MNISRHNGIIHIRDSVRGFRVSCPVLKVGELASLLTHAATFRTEDELEVKKKKSPEAAAKATARAEAAAKEAKTAEKAEKTKKKITFADADKNIVKPLKFIAGLLEEAPKNRMTTEDVANALAAYGSSKGEKKNLAAAEAAITGLVRTKRLTDVGGKLRIGPGPAAKVEAEPAKTGTDDE